MSTKAQIQVYDDRTRAPKGPFFATVVGCKSADIPISKLASEMSSNITDTILTGIIVQETSDIAGGFEYSTHGYIHVPSSYPGQVDMNAARHSLQQSLKGFSPWDIGPEENRAVRRLQLLGEAIDHVVRSTDRALREPSGRLAPSTFVTFENTRVDYTSFGQAVEGTLISPNYSKASFLTSVESTNDGEFKVHVKSLFWPAMTAAEETQKEDWDTQLGLLVPTIQRQCHGILDELTTSSGEHASSNLNDRQRQRFLIAQANLNESIHHYAGLQGSRLPMGKIAVRPVTFELFKHIFSESD